MTIIDIIDKKRTDQELSFEEIKYAIDGYLDGEIEDYQMSSLLMAISINGMTDEETINLTNVMLHSGDIIDLSDISGVKVDKHSTGGVGDKTTLILAPLVASCGVKFAKMSGRGLGHTGGTIDKLEAIDGFNVKITEKRFIKQVNDIGVAVVSQAGNLVPADKKIYALRDVSGTVSSIPLIAASIMSKKLDSGADKIIIDVKVGNGALLKTIKEARALARLMVKIGKQNNKETVCILSNMNQPLGKAVGNGVEVLESIDLLKGNGPKDLYELIIALSSVMVSLGKNIDIKKAEEEVIRNLANGEAYKKFVQMVDSQGGNIDEINISNKKYSIKSSKEGYINHIDTFEVGELVREMGAGRLTKDDIIDHGVGLIFNKKLGDYVMKDEELVKVYYANKKISSDNILSCFTIEKNQIDLEPLIYEMIK